MDFSRQDRSAAAPEPVTVRTPQNAYAYSTRNLAVAYGLSVASTLAIVVAGLLCIHAAEGTFSMSFSTVLRTTRGPQLDDLVRASEAHGKDPLPSRLAKTEISLRHDNNRAWFVVEGMAVTPEVELLERRGDELKQISAREHEVGRDASEDSLLVAHKLSYRSPT